MSNSLETNEKDQLKSWLLLIFLAVIWGLSFILVKKIVHTFTAVELGAGRIFIAGIALAPWAIKNIKKLDSKKIPTLIVSGLTGYLIPAFIFGIVGSKLNSSLAGTLNATTPLFVLVIGGLFFHKRITKSQVFGLLIAFTGSLLLILSGGTHSLDFNNPYALLVIVATIMYGLNANIVGISLSGIKPIIISSFSLIFVGSISFFILIFSTDFFHKILLEENRTLLIYFLLLGVINSGIAAVVYNYVLQISSPVFASSVTYLIPIVATIAGLFDGETIVIWHYLGMGIILLGIYLLNKK